MIVVRLNVASSQVKSNKVMNEEFLKKEKIFSIGKTDHFIDGGYCLPMEHRDPDGNICYMYGSIMEYEDIVSCQFNQLKGKLFNLIESSITEEKQREAMKGLVKDFCNEKYKNTLTDLEGWIKRLGFNFNNIPQGGCISPKEEDNN